MANLVQHREEGQVFTTTNTAATVVKYKLREGWSYSITARVHARLNALTGADFSLRCSCKMTGGVLTIDGTPVVDAVTGDASLTGVALSFSVSADSGYISVRTPGVAATQIWWVGVIQAYSFH
jgi:hypothetical protein